MKKKVTIHDIARKLNTSASTVSRALQDHPRISEAMKQRVKEVARELKYQPDDTAISLRKGKRNILGIIVPQVDRHFFARVIRGVEEEAGARGYNILIGQSYEQVSRETVLVDRLGKVAEGLLISVSTQTREYGHLTRLVEQEVPVVFFDRIPGTLVCDSVTIDDKEAAFRVTEHMIRSGLQRIIHFAGPQHINVYHERTQGYRMAMEKHGIPVPDEWIVHDTLTRETGYMAMQKLASLNVFPQAVMSSGDYSALGTLIWCKDNRISVPGELCIAGFANEPFTSLITPGMTSVEQHGLEMGRKAAALLLDRIEGQYAGTSPRKIVIPSELFIRESSMPLQHEKKTTY